MLKVILLLVCWTTTLYAQDDTTAKTQDEKPAQQAQNAESEKTGEKTPEQLTPDTFDPSEKVIEGYSVDFPVDI